MKRVWLIGLVLFLCIPASGFGQSLTFDGIPTLSSLAENVTVNPYAQVGFQWLGSNLNLPVQNESLAPFLNIGDLDIALKDANFWSGTVGLTVVSQEKYSFFAAAGGFPSRGFLTSGVIPVSLGLGSTSANLEFTNTGTESWFIQTGIGLGPVLLGLYWDQFSFSLEDPRNQNGPIANQTLRADILTKTFAPFVGLSLPAGNAMLTVTYSPWATSNTALSLRSSQTGMSELRYTWKKPGDLVIALLQYNTPLSSSTTFGVWCNYSWMRMRQEAELEFEYVSPPLVHVSRSRDVTATMTKYAVGGGVSLGVLF